MGILDYIIAKSNEEKNQFEGVISCFNLFGCFPPDMNLKAQKKFVKKYGKFLKNKGYTFN